MNEQYGQYLKEFLSYLQFEKRYSRHTNISYENDLQQFFTYLTSQFDSPAIATITAMMVRNWLAELKQDTISAKSINRKISSLKSFFKYQLKNGVITQTPMTTVTSPKVSKRLPVYIEEKHLDTLFNHVEFPDTWQGKTEKLVLALFYATGMRLSELVGLKESQLDIANRHVKVLGKGNKERVIPISADLLNQLKEYIASKPVAAAEIFITPKGKPLNTRAVYAFVNKYLATVSTVQKKSPHVLRHSFATHLMNNGAELNAVKELLGHSSLAATQIYTHNSIEKLKEVFKKAHPKA